MPSESMVLILDSCTEVASVALLHEGRILRERRLLPRSASSALLETVREVLDGAGAELHGLSGVGVVHGPGSFTGVRVGLALAKGFCEAAALPLAAVSRLAVLAEAAGGSVAVASSAGRDQVYLRTGVANGFSERLVHDLDLLALRKGGSLVVDSVDLLRRLEAGGPTNLLAITAAHAMDPVLRCLARGGSDVAQIDANYVREESTIYRQAGRAIGKDSLPL